MESCLRHLARLVACEWATTEICRAPLSSIVAVPLLSSWSPLNTYSSSIEKKQSELPVPVAESPRDHSESSEAGK